MCDRRGRELFDILRLEDQLQNDEVIVKRDQTTEERDNNEPEQAVTRTGTKSDAKEVEFSEESGERRQPG